MGWTFLHRRKGLRTEDILQEHMRPFDLLATRSVGNVVYAAIKNPEDGHVFGAVILTAYHNNEYCNWGFKFIEESMGPMEQDCPAAILNMLSPPRGQYAEEWRERCRAKLAKQKPKAGCRIVFDKPVTFRSGLSEREFTCLSLRPARYQTDDGQVVNIPPSYVKRAEYTIQ